MDCRRSIRRAFVVLSFGLVLCSPALARAQVFEPINSFTGCDPLGCPEGSDGGRPDAALVVGPDGNFYGTTFEFPGGRLGTIYRVTPSGTRTTLVDFSEPSTPTESAPWGAFPIGRLAVGPDGFYGVTDQGGLHSGGTLFRLSFSGVFAVLHHFALNEGFTGCGGPAFGPAGDLFGITCGGGDFNAGTVFRWDGAAVTTIHSFGSSDTGMYPKGDLTLASDGNVYGATNGGGGVATPTLFRITPSDTVELFHTFVAPVHGGSNGGLLQASDGHLYGTMYFGSGTVFRITLDGILTPLQSNVPTSGNLVEGFGGVIYGTTDNVFGNPNWGTIFQITPGGALTTIHTFDGTSGRQPKAGLVRGPDGHLYGTTYAGGTHTLGIFYRLAMPPAVDVTANGLQGPLTLKPGEPLAIRVAFDVPGGTQLALAHVLIGFVSPVGVYWMGPAGFGTTPVVLYSGPLPEFAPVPLLNFSSTAGLPAGDYYWFMYVVENPTRVFVDAVHTVVP
jgi:uncharacterized repeat protein (TIGR03803 family)